MILEFVVSIRVISNGFIVRFPEYWGTERYIPRFSSMMRTGVENKPLIIQDSENLIAEIRNILCTWLKTINEAGSVD